MTGEALVVPPEKYDTALNVVGTSVTVLASVARTKGYEITLQKGDSGMGPPPHSHGWDESFFVLKGTILFQCDGRETLCKPGTLVHVPAGTVHAFSYGESGGEMLEIAGKGSQATQMFTDFNNEVPSPPDISKVLAVWARNGVTPNL